MESNMRRPIRNHRNTKSLPLLLQHPFNTITEPSQVSSSPLASSLGIEIYLRVSCEASLWQRLLLKELILQTPTSISKAPCSGVTATEFSRRRVCLRETPRRSVRRCVHLAALSGPEWSPASWAAWRFCPSTSAGRTWWGPQTGWCTPAKHTQRPSKETYSHTTWFLWRE